MARQNCSNLPLGSKCKERNFYFKFWKVRSEKKVRFNFKTLVLSTETNEPNDYEPLYSLNEP